MIDHDLDVRLTDLLERVGQVVRRARLRTQSAAAGDVEAGAFEVEVIAACEQVAHMTTSLQLRAIESLEDRRRRTHPPVDPADAASVERADRQVERSLRAEVSMARGVSSGAARYSVGLARTHTHLPRTRALLDEGIVSTSVAAAVCREAEMLPAAEQTRLDDALADHLPDLSVRRAASEARRLALLLDPAGSHARADRARKGRRIGLRRERDAMATLTVRGPAEQVVAAWNGLAREALTVQASGTAGGRTHAQISCDLALASLRAGADVPTPGLVPAVEIGVLMRPEVLLGEDAPAVLEGYGPIPGPLARRIVEEGAWSDRAWIRRFFTSPDGSRIVDVDERRRRFPATVARMVRAADDTCLRPSCDCDSHTIDHVHAHARGGASTLDNAAGTCWADNQLKEMGGWDVAVGTDGPGIGRGDESRWRTPTGHAYSVRRRHPDPSRTPESQDPETLRPEAPLPETPLPETPRPETPRPETPRSEAPDATARHVVRRRSERLFVVQIATGGALIDADLHDARPGHRWPRVELPPLPDPEDLASAAELGLYQALKRLRQ